MAEDLSEVHDLAASTRRRWPSWSPCGGTRRAATTCSRSTTGSSRPIAHPKPDQRRPRGPTATSRAEPGTRVGGGRRAQPLPPVSVTVEVPEGVVPAGVLLALGCALGGWSLHVLDGRLRYVHNLHGAALDAVDADPCSDRAGTTSSSRFEKDEGLGGRGHARRRTATAVARA